MILSDLATGVPLRTFDAGPQSGVHAIALLPDGRTALLGALNSGTYLWDLGVGTRLNLVGSDGDHATSLRILPGHRLVLGPVVIRDEGCGAVLILAVYPMNRLFVGSCGG